MNKIFEQSKDLHVSASVIYGKSGDTKAYADEACTVQMTTAELKEAVIKRAIIQIGTDIFIPIAFTVVSKAGTVRYIKPNASTATSADIASLSAVAEK